MQGWWSKYSLKWLVATVVVASVPLASQAQVTPPTAGTILKQTVPPRQLPRAPRSVITLPRPAQQANAAALSFKVRHITIDGNTLVPTAALLPLVQGLEGKTDRLADLQAACTRITNYYHQQGYPLAYAYVPAQKVAGGNVRIAIIEPRYDHIRVKARGRLRPAQAVRTLDLQSGAPIRQSSLERGLLLLNQTPGVRVTGTLVPGQTTGTSNLDVTTHATPLARFSAGVDNYGSPDTGRVRGLISGTLDDPFGYGGQIAANALRTSGGLLQSEGLSLMSPNLGWGWRIGAYGSHTHYTLGGAFAALHEHGHANQYGIYASVPLILAPGRILEARLDLLRDQFAQSSATVGLDDRSHLDLARLTVAGSWADPHGTTASGIVVTGGRKVFSTAGALAADAEGPQTAGRFWIGQVRVQRIQSLPHGFDLRAGLSGQIASHNLDASQQFYLGGPMGVMNYAVGAAGGDAGALLRLGLFHAIPTGAGQLNIGALLQGGEVWLHHSTFTGAATPNHADLYGGGVELDYAVAAWLDLQLAYVHRIGSTALPASSGGESSGEFWGSLQLRF